MTQELMSQTKEILSRFSGATLIPHRSAPWNLIDRGSHFNQTYKYMACTDMCAIIISCPAHTLSMSFRRRGLQLDSPLRTADPSKEHFS